MGSTFSNANSEVKRVEYLGQGRFGQVWLVDVPDQKQSKKARDNDEGLDPIPAGRYALKEIFIHPSVKLSEQATTASTSASRKENREHSQETEVQVLKELNHPNVLKMVGSTRAGCVLRIFTEFADSGDLAHLLEKSVAVNERPLQEVVGLAIIAQISSALQYIHSKRVIHRDLKPANVLLTAQGQCKVGDFGISKLLNDTTCEQRNTFVGSPCYMSPELYRGVAYDRKTDIWSLGVLGYETLVGKRPFDGNILALAKKVDEGSYDPVPTWISEKPRTLVQKLLSLDPADRPEASAALEIGGDTMLLFSQDPSAAVGHVARVIAALGLAPEQARVDSGRGSARKLRSRLSSRMRNAVSPARPQAEDTPPRAHAELTPVRSAPILHSSAPATPAELPSGIFKGTMELGRSPGDFLSPVVDRAAGSTTSAWPMFPPDTHSRCDFPHGRRDGRKGRHRGQSLPPAPPLPDAPHKLPPWFAQPLPPAVPGHGRTQLPSVKHDKATWNTSMTDVRMHDVLRGREGIGSTSGSSRRALSTAGDVAHFETFRATLMI